MHCCTTSVIYHLTLHCIIFLRFLCQSDNFMMAFNNALIGNATTLIHCENNEKADSVCKIRKPRSLVRLKWSEEEDQKLRFLVRKYGKQNWRSVAYGILV